ncbi:hypothetical protein CON03_08555 [Bacillus cereus]|nr:hypothetical protein CON03_08555 [Bacillus cereus]
MKLNHDCVRDLLLTVEESDRNELLSLHFLLDKNKLQSYSEDDIVYTIQRLIEAGYINADTQTYFEGQDAIISSITWNGHQFLDNIRDKSIWEKTKEKASVVGGVSLPILSELAKSYLAEKLGLKS